MRMNTTTKGKTYTSLLDLINQLFGKTGKNALVFDDSANVVQMLQAFQLDENEVKSIAHAYAVIESLSAGQFANSLLSLIWLYEPTEYGLDVSDLIQNQIEACKTANEDANIAYIYDAGIATFMQTWPAEETIGRAIVEYTFETFRDFYQFSVNIVNKSEQASSIGSIPSFSQLKKQYDDFINNRVKICADLIKGIYTFLTQQPSFDVFTLMEQHALAYKHPACKRLNARIQNNYLETAK